MSLALSGLIFNHYMIDYWEANFALEGDRVKSRGLFANFSVYDKKQLFLDTLDMLTQHSLSPPLTISESEWATVSLVPCF